MFDKDLRKKLIECGLNNEKVTEMMSDTSSLQVIELMMENMFDEDIRNKLSKVMDEIYEENF